MCISFHFVKNVGAVGRQASCHISPIIRFCLLRFLSYLERSLLLGFFVGMKPRRRQIKSSLSCTIVANKKQFSKAENRCWRNPRYDDLKDKTLGRKKILQRKKVYGNLVQNPLISAIIMAMGCCWLLKSHIKLAPKR